MAKKENKELKKAMEIIDEMSMDEKEWELYESRMKAIYDYNTGIHSAKDEGFKERNEARKIKNSKRNVKIKNTNR